MEKMIERIKLFVYRHKENRDVYLVRNWNVVGGNQNTEFYKATKSILEAIGSTNNINADEFEHWFYRFVDDDGNSLLMAKLVEQKQITVDGFSGTGTRTSCFAVKDFERIELTEKKMDKNTPQKPTHEATKPECYTCPNCKNVIGDRFLKISGIKVRIKERFCNICGQEIDWDGVDDFYEIQSN